MRLPILLLCATGNLSALTIQIDYSLDTNNFFSTQERRDAIEAVAEFYGDLIQDNLLGIDPAGFSQASWVARPRHPETNQIEEMPDLVVPEDTIIVFVGSRNLSGNTRGVAGPGGFSASGFSSWFARIRGRGQTGAESGDAATVTDVAPWGGSISFDADTTWNFSLTGNGTGTEFLTVALHEMGHVLGIGTANTWDNQIVNGVFTGGASAASFGSAPPADTGHFLLSSGSLNSPLYGSFNTTHGNNRPVLMLGSFTDTGSNFDVATDLDLAALIDLGWEIKVPTTVTNNFQLPSSASFTWPSSSFLNYQLERSGDLVTFPDGSPSLVGNGTTLSWTDTSPPSERAFYRLVATDNTTSAAQELLVERKASIVDFGKVQSIAVEGRVVEGCGCIALEHDD